MFSVKTVIGKSIYRFFFFLFFIYGYLLSSNSIYAQTWQTNVQAGNNSYNTGTFKKIFFVNATNGWAVGDNGLIMATTNGGTTWVNQTSGSNSFLGGVFFISTTQGWAVGSEGTILSTSNGGTTWTTQLFTSGSNAQFYDVFFTSATQGWAVGFFGRISTTTDGGITWTTQNSNSVFQLYGVYFTSSTRGHAVGNGRYWSTLDGGLNWTVSNAATNNSIHFTDANTGWRAGPNGNIEKTINGGGTWTTQTSGTTTNLQSIRFADSNNGWAVGDNNVILRTTNGGTTWTTVASPVYTNFRSIFFISSTQGWIAGEDGTIINTTDGGTAWAIQQYGNQNSFSSVQFTSNQIGYAASDKRLFKSSNGGLNWSVLVNSIPASSTTLFRSFFVNDNLGWIVGSNGLVNVTTDGGTSFQSQNSGTVRTLNDIQMLNAQNGFIVGTQGTIIGTTNGGTNWNAQTSGVTVELRALSFINAQQGWVVGSNGTILTTSNGGATWITQSSGTTTTLRDVYFVNQQLGWACGDNGLLLTTSNGGTTWTSQTSGTTRDFNALFFVSATKGWAAGSSGTVVTTDNGGQTWVSQSTNTTNALNALFFQSASKGWVVGQRGTVQIFSSPSIVPTITSFSPISAKPGDGVTITGTNFSNTPLNSVVFFGATRATVTAATATSLSVTVPVGATFAPISVLNTNTILSAISNANFNPIFNPVKTGISAVDFETKVDFSTGNTSIPRYVAVGDLDGDGKADLVLANGVSPGIVSVFRNTSTIGSITATSFGARQDFAVGNEPYFVSLADVDGDGKLELLIANYSSSSVSVLRNTSTVGSISFITKQDFSVADSPSVLAFADIDSDGKVDLVSANINSTISVLRNTSNLSNISFTTKQDFSIGAMSPYGLAVSDLDADGKPDMVVSNSGTSTISVFRNTSTLGTIDASSFAAKQDFSSGGVNNLNQVVIADIDNDAKPEIVVADINSSNVLIFKNNASTGSINANSFSAPVKFAVGNAYGVTVGDVDGDGKPDIASANYTNSAFGISVLRNISATGTIDTNSFSAKKDFNTSTNAGTLSVVLGDIDGDGRPDLISANSTTRSISIFRNADINNPTALLAGTLTAFSTCASTASATQNFTVSATNLTANLILSAPTGFEISLTNTSGFSNLLTITPTNGIVNNTTIFIRLSSTATGSPTGNITAASTNATTQNLAVTGTVTPTNNIAIVTQPQATLAACLSGALSISVSASGTNLTYQWFRGANAITGATANTLTIAAITASDAAAYTVTVSGICGVPVTSNASVVTLNSQTQITSQPITTISQCANSIATISVTATGTNLTYQWFKDNNIIAGATASIYTDNNFQSNSVGAYTVRVAGACGTLTSNASVWSLITSPLSITVTANPSTVSRGQTTQLTAIAPGATNFVWTPALGITNPTSNSSIARVLNTTTYSVTGTNTQGCAVTGTVLVTAVDDFNVTAMEVFTPNGDGINDFFVIRNIDVYTDNRLTIYDKNGRLVYDKNGYLNNWDGMHNGKPLQKDTYYYVLQIKNQIIRKGAITLIR
jgi:gliding motility-associated-like protein